MGKLLNDGLTKLGFVNNPAPVSGFSKDFWQKDGYTFSSREVGCYAIVREGVFNEWQEGGKTVKSHTLREKRFKTRKRLDDRADQEILDKLTAWLTNPEF